MKRLLLWKWNLLRGPLRLLGPAAIGALGIGLIATGGVGAIGGTIGTLVLAFTHFAVMRAYGRPLPANKPWPRALTGFGILGVALTALWGLFSLWGLPVLIVGKLLGTVGIPLIAAATSWIAWRQVELLKGSSNRVAARQEELGEQELNRARRVLQEATHWVNAPLLAQALKTSEERADGILEHLYIKGELRMEVGEDGGVVFRWEDVPRLSGEVTDEEIERLLREE